MERMVIKFFLWAIIGAGFGYLFEATPAICGVIAFIFGLTGAIFGAVDAAERKQEQQKTAGNRT